MGVCRRCGGATCPHGYCAWCGDDCPKCNPQPEVGMGRRAFLRAMVTVPAAVVAAPVLALVPEAPVVEVPRLLYGTPYYHLLYHLPPFSELWVKYPRPGAYIDGLVIPDARRINVKDLLDRLDEGGDGE